MSKISFVHGGKDYDDKYPEGIPTKLDIALNNGNQFSSGLVMFPSGHSKNTTSDLKGILNNKNKILLNYSSNDSGYISEFLAKLNNIESLSNSELENIYDFKFILAEKSIDSI